MACFLVPATEAVVTTVVQSVMKNKEKRGAESTAHAADAIENANAKTPFSVKLGWLNKMLWGGSALLAFEHIWHGEVIPTFPFLTAVQNGETADMLAEMGTAGVGMAVLVTLIWAGMVVAANAIEKRSDDQAQTSKEES